MMIEVNGLAITVLRKKIKNLNLRIHRTGAIQISIPTKFPLMQVYEFLKNKQPWIEHHRLRLKTLSQSAHAASKQLISGDTLLFLGQTHELHVDETASTNHIERMQDALYFHLKTPLTLPQKQLLLDRWYKVQMQERLPALFEKWENLIGVKSQSYTIKKMKSRWGSCHPVKKHICLNLKLIEKPLVCLEYVLVHELVHLLEASHNRRFHALMTQYMPEWKQVKKQLGAIL